MASDQGTRGGDPAAPARRGGRGRGRRPADEVRGEVLAAAGRILLDEGMSALTFDRVSAESGASRTTLHKWWPSRGALALEAYFDAVEETLRFPDTGDLTADLTSQLTAFVRLMTDTSAGRVIAELVGQCQSDPDLGVAFRAHYSRDRRTLAVERLERARELGQVRVETDAEAVVDQLWGACYHRLLIPDEPLTERFAATLVSQLLRGIVAGGPRPAAGADDHDDR